MGLAHGVRLGGYEILAPLGAGGMGEVYRAHDEMLRRDVAIKILPTESQHDIGVVQRFIQEARAASALNHPNIITIYGAGQIEAGHFIVMELVRGRTLRSLMGSPMAMDVLRDVGAQIARALATAHDAGIVHRDVKPENVMVRDDGYVKVLDFGLARLERVATDAATQTVGTVTQQVVGTLRYLSPERARGDAGGTATDVFSLGIVLYELASGRHPFHAGSSFEVVLAIVGDQPVLPSRWNGEVPRDLDILILQMLDKDPAKRPTASDVARALAAQPRHGVTVTAEKVARGRHTVGRERERGDLRTGFESVTAGHGLVVCVTGEPGLGKSTLVEDFIEEQQQADVGCQIARGRCSERLAGTEAYLPLLDALENLLRSPEDGPRLARLLNTVAPLWHAQIAASTTDVESKAERSPAATSSQERLKRELVAFVEEATRTQPLILFVDDIHWADVSTVDVLSYVASRFESMPLLIFVTYRPEELLREKHPFLRVQQDLQARGCCRELRLEFLTPADVAAYLDLEFPDHQFPSSFIQLVHEKTEGNPLFMVDVLRYLRDRGVLAKQEGRWTLSQRLPDIARALPESVRSMIQRKIDALDETDRRLLVTASVQGYEFDGAVMAQMVRMEAAEVEERLERLDRIYGFVRPLREVEYPDRTLTLRYRFVHVLYQNLFYATLTPGRKVALSKAVADLLQTSYGAHVAEIAAELAVLYDVAREFARAAAHFLTAAQRAAHVFAYQEAILLGERGLQALQALPESPERKRRELALLVTMGVPLIAARGFTHPRVEEVHSRARALCLELNDRTELFRVLWGLWSFHYVGLHLEDADEVACSLLELAQNAHDAGLLVQAHHALGQICCYRADSLVALEHFERVVTLYDPQAHRGHTQIYGYDPYAVARALRAWMFWTVGHPDRALKEAEAALQVARELSHPRTLATVLYYAAVLHQFRGEWEPARQYGEEVLAVANDRSLPHFVGIGMVLIGLDRSQRGESKQGIVQMREGLAAYQATGAQTSRPRFRAQLAEQLGKTGRLEEAVAILTDEISSIGSAGFHLAELYRVKGDLLLLGNYGDGASDAESSFLQAIDVARHQNAKSFELRAITSLCRLWCTQGKRHQARELLANSYAWFTEGFGTGDLKEAKALLEASSG